MIKEIHLKGKKIEYDLQYKPVKNINLRIKSDGTVYVSAGRRVSEKVVEEFIISKTDFILKALEKYEKLEDMPKIQYFSEEELKNVVLEMCRKVYPCFEKRGISFPQIKFRKMVSRWGSCHTRKKILTFNTNLIYAPPECIEYVVIHEFAHFLQPNHSDKFYAEVEKLCPGRKEAERKLKKINIRRND